VSDGPLTRHLPIKTPRLLLRDIADGDAPAIHAYASDAAVVRHLDWGPNTADDTARFLAAARAARDAVPRIAYHLAIALRAADQVVGGCRIEIRSAASGSGDIGYVLAPGVWGQGYATEATRALLTFGFQSLALHRIWATCDVENRASMRVLEKLGMEQEGLLRQNVRRKGEWRDSYLYAILEPDWRGRAGST
jgi:RimJ/RimL family protein N-acetyltransferase